MYKNQLQELAQRSCFNLPAYTCIREGPDHAPRFKAVVNFNGENFESPAFCNALRQAEHAAAEVALTALSKQGPSRSLAAKVLDETGVYKNLLQETSHRAGLNLPVYTTIRSGPGHTPVFKCIVELAGLSFTGEPAKTKKQAQKNAALAAWSALKQLPHLEVPTSSSLPCLSSPLQNSETNECQHQDQAIVARALAKLRSFENIKASNNHGRGGERSYNTTTTIYDQICLNSNTTSPPFQSWPSSTNLLSDNEMHKLWHHQEHSPPRKQTQLPSLSVVPTICSSQASIQYLTDRVNSLPIFFSGYSSAGSLPGLLQSQPTLNDINNSRKDVSEGFFPDHLRNNNSGNDGVCRSHQWTKHSRPRESPSIQSHSTAAQANFRTNRVDSFMASPVNIRTAIPVCSARPVRRSSYLKFQSTALAPAVHIRPVASVPLPSTTCATITGKEE